jgi:hypothetical protein
MGTNVRKALLVLIAVGFSAGCALRRNIGIEEVLAALTAADRKIDNFCSLERSFTYHHDGRLIEGERRGVHFYAKPDESLLCVSVPSAPSNIYYETGTVVTSLEGGKTTRRTLSDSLFLRDWRSMLRLQGAPQPIRFEFAGGARTAPRRRDGIYEIQIVRPGYEKAVLRVDARMGVVLEKSVYQLPSGNRLAREVHSEFVPLAGSYLPGKTVYEYAGRTVSITWSDYRANLPVDLERMNLDQSTCERLMALTDAVSPTIRLKVPPLRSSSESSE